MKMFSKFICVFAFAVVALAHADVAEKNVAPGAEKNHPSREHRSSYFSVNWGLSYLSSERKSSDFGFSSSIGSTRLDGRYERLEQYGQHDEQESFSAWGFPTIDIRFGRAFGNLFAVHFSFGVGLFSGEGERHKQDYAVHRSVVDNVIESEEKELNGIMNETIDSYGFYGSLGFGFTVYPIRNPASLLNGLFVGLAGGIQGSMARDDVYATDYCTVGGVFTRYELGKDWWVSDTWSVGVGLSFTKVVYEFVDEGEKSKQHVVSLFFRLTRG
ncbi:hypothetical protein IKQ19_09310 [Candidatus Saccharibacteria bacterium]|nr:hypothetical protein [Candidatus Saccharibacteria bacterium]